MAGFIAFGGGAGAVFNALAGFIAFGGGAGADFFGSLFLAALLSERSRSARWLKRNIGFGEKWLKQTFFHLFTEKQGNKHAKMGRAAQKREH